MRSALDLLSDLCDGVRDAPFSYIIMCELRCEEISHLYNKVVISHLGNLSCCWRDAKINRRAQPLSLNKAVNEMIKWACSQHTFYTSYKGSAKNKMQLLFFINK
jgi:hypothetical protein